MAATAPGANGRLFKPVKARGRMAAAAAARVRMVVAVGFLVCLGEMIPRVDGMGPTNPKPEDGADIACTYHETHVLCNISGFEEMQMFHHPENCEEVVSATEETGKFVEYLVAAVVAIMFAGIMSGLTIGLMSFDDKNLAILKIQSECPEEKKQAHRVHSLIHDHHLLLVTLLLWNAAAFESLPLFIDKLVPSVYAVLISVTFILIFGEILPQAICTGPRRLAVASAAYYPVKVLMFVSYPISIGFARTLDYILGSKEERNSSMMYIDPEAVGLPKGTNNGKMMLVEVHGYIDHQTVEKSSVKKAKTKKGGHTAVSADDSFNDTDAILSEA